MCVCVCVCVCARARAHVCTLYSVMSQHCQVVNGKAVCDGEGGESCDGEVGEL